jgi:hypothetical protein
MNDSSAPQRSYVKGLWFVSARRYALPKFGSAKMDEVVAYMPERYQVAMRAPLASEWYEEEALAHGMRAARDVLGDGTDAGLLTILEETTQEGINRFWRAALRVMSTELAVRMLPATWRHVRRGPGELTVQIEGKRGVVRYARFPYFHDPNYRTLALGTIRPLMRIATGTPARVEIAGYGPTWCDVEVRFP